MVRLFGAKPVADAIQARKAWFQQLIGNIDNKARLVATSSSWERYNFFGPVFGLCPSSQLQSFATGDEEKRVCDISLLTKLSRGTCEIISLGSAGQWNFEQSIFARTSCRVHTFDCTGTFPSTNSAPLPGFQLPVVHRQREPRHTVHA